MEIFSKQYDGESIVDLNRDVSEAFDERFNNIVRSVPKDEYCIHQGTFTVTITWSPE